MAVAKVHNGINYYVENMNTGMIRKIEVNSRLFVENNMFWRAEGKRKGYGYKNENEIKKTKKEKKREIVIYFGVLNYYECFVRQNINKNITRTIKPRCQTVLVFIRRSAAYLPLR